VTAVSTGATADSEPLPHRGISVRGLRKSFRDSGGRKEVLRGVDLDIAAGEVIGLIGANGAGKTTLMSCLLGFLFPDAGELLIDGCAIDDLTIRARTGFVPERMAFGRNLHGRDFVRYMARLTGLSSDEAAVRTDDLMKRLELTEAADRPLGNYSRGMLQRIGLCQALVNEPDFLFLDEPTSGLDPSGLLLVRGLIAEQKARGATVLLNSHQLAEVERICDRVFFLRDGRVEHAETLRSTDRIPIAIGLLAGSFDVEVLRGHGLTLDGNVASAIVADDAAIAELIRKVIATGAGVVEVRRATADLEQMAVVEETYRRAMSNALLILGTLVVVAFGVFNAPQIPYGIAWLIVLGTGSQLIGPEFSSGTLQLIVAKPVNRSSYLLSRVAGAFAVIVTVDLITAASLAVGKFAGNNPDSWKGLGEAAAKYALDGLMALALLALFGSFTRSYANIAAYLVLETTFSVLLAWLSMMRLPRDHSSALASFLQRNPEVIKAVKGLDGNLFPDATTVTPQLALLVLSNSAIALFLGCLLFRRREIPYGAD
jgi:ABC-type multidrug transport system ATPase subunit/ABC-type transport system involved in multi-copper enzyme maturation permease subunit